MTASWYGESCFRIQGGGAMLLLDVYGRDSDLAIPRGKFDVVIGSPENVAHFGARGDAFVIAHPGEYEILGIFIQGFALAARAKKGDEPEAERTIWRIALEGMVLAHFDAMKAGDMTSELMDALGTIDILLLPVGGGGAFPPEDAVAVMNQIEPRIMVPMRYRINKRQNALLPVQDFLKAAGETNPIRAPKLVMKKKNLPQQENTRILIIDPTHEQK